MSNITDKERPTPSKPSSTAIENSKPLVSELGLSKRGESSSIAKEESKEAITATCSNVTTNGNKDDTKVRLIRDRPSSCVFVASLSSSYSDDELCNSVTNYFTKWGTLGGVKVLRDPHNRPYAFVQYNNDGDANKAILEAHNTELGGRIIRCEHAKVNRTLFFSSATRFSDHEMKTQMKEFGEIEQLFPSNDKGYLISICQESESWYVKFAYREDAIRAFANLKTDGSKVIEWAQNIECDQYSGLEGHQDESSIIDNYYSRNLKDDMLPMFDKKSVFVGQLSVTVTKEELARRFSTHGEIAEIVLTKRPKTSFAFITYQDEISAACAVEKENHAMFQDKTMHVQYKEIHPTLKNSSAPSSAFFSRKVGSNTEVSSQVHGVALAPPPINLTRKQHSSGINYRRLLHDQSNRFSKSFQYSNKTHNLYHNNATRFFPAHKWNVDRQGFNAVGTHKQVEVKNGCNFQPPPIPTLLTELVHRNVGETPPPTIESDTPTSTAGKSEKSSHLKEVSGFASTTGTGSTTMSHNDHTKSVNRMRQPYFYYIPTNEVAANTMQGNYGGPPLPPHALPQYYSHPQASFYYPYYPRYDGPQDCLNPVPYYQYYFPSIVNEDEEEPVQS